MKELLHKKQREKREEEEEELKLIRREAEVWKFINKKRGKKTWKENNIDKSTWRNYFKKLLDGSDRKEIEENRENDKQNDDILEEKEIWKAIRKLKIKKAAGVDGVPMEAWRYAGNTLWKRLVDLLTQIWRDGDIPEDWKKSVIVPLYKKGDQEEVGNYRGISLLCIAYKIYAEILRGRLERETEEKRLLPETQCGFRKGLSTMNNIFVLNHVVQREVADKKGRRVSTLLADLKAAFDKIDRQTL